MMFMVAMWVEGSSLNTWGLFGCALVLAILGGAARYWLRKLRFQRMAARLRLEFLGNKKPKDVPRPDVNVIMLAAQVIYDNCVYGELDGRTVFCCDYRSSFGKLILLGAWWSVGTRNTGINSGSIIGMRGVLRDVTPLDRYGATPTAGDGWTFLVSGTGLFRSARFSPVGLEKVWRKMSRLLREQAESMTGVEMGEVVIRPRHENVGRRTSRG